MLNTTLTSASPHAAAGQLAFRICGSARDGQIVRLHAPKCTVGAGPRCTLRLRARGIAPLHCLIVRGPQATIVRRWSADTRLNGQAFTDALLRPGDRLSLGAIELEVLDAAVLGRDDTAAPGPPSINAWQQWQTEREESQRRLDDRSQQLAAFQAELDARQKTLEEERTQLADCQQVLQQRRSQLEAQQHAMEEDRRRWQAEQNEAASRTAAQLQQDAARQTEMEACRRALDACQQQWHAEREASERKLDERARQLDVLQAELEAGQEALQEDRRRGETQQREAASQMAEREQQHAIRQAELEAHHRTLAERRQQWEAEQDESQRQFKKQAEQLHALQVEREKHQQALAQRLRQEEDQKALAQRLRQEEDQKADEQRRRQEEDQKALAQRLRQEEDQKASEQRRRQEHVNPADTRPAAAEAVPPADGLQKPAARPIAPAASPKNPPQHSGEEESIDNYMTQLLERLRRGNNGVQAPAHRVAPVSPKPPAEPPCPVAEKPEEAKVGLPAAAPPLDKQVEMAETSPRAVAPETHVSLAAMRELANLSAHSAISRHIRRQIAQSTRIKLLIVFQGLTAGGVLLWLWGWPGAGALTLCGALASFVTSVIWGTEYAFLTGRLVRGKFGPIKWNRSAAASHPPAEKLISAEDLRSRGRP